MKLPDPVGKEPPVNVHVGNDPPVSDADPLRLMSPLILIFPDMLAVHVCHVPSDKVNVPLPVGQEPPTKTQLGQVPPESVNVPEPVGQEPPVRVGHVPGFNDKLPVRVTVPEISPHVPGVTDPGLETSH